MHEHWEKRLDEVPWLRTDPIDCFRRQCMLSRDPDEPTVADVVNFIGEDHVRWASDYPHWGTIYPGAVAISRSAASIAAAFSPEPQQAANGGCDIGSAPRSGCLTIKIHPSLCSAGHFRGTARISRIRYNHANFSAVLAHTRPAAWAPSPRIRAARFDGVRGIVHNSCATITGMTDQPPPQNNRILTRFRAALADQAAAAITTGGRYPSSRRTLTAAAIKSKNKMRLRPS